MLADAFVPPDLRQNPPFLLPEFGFNLNRNFLLLLDNQKAKPTKSKTETSGQIFVVQPKENKHLKRGRTALLARGKLCFVSGSSKSARNFLSEVA